MNFNGLHRAQFDQNGSCLSIDAAKMYQIAIQKNMDANKFSIAAKLDKELAELFEAEMKDEEAMKYYEKAADCFRAEDSATYAMDG